MNTKNLDLGVPTPGPASMLTLGPLRAIVRRHLRALWRHRNVAFTWFVVEPWIALLAVALGIGKLVGTVNGDMTYATFVTPGIVMGTAMFHALGNAAWAAFDRVNQNVYETMLTAPVTVAELVGAELVFASINAMLSTLSVGGLAVAFGWIPLASLPMLLLISLGVGLLFGGIGQCFAATMPNFQSLTLVFTLMATPLYFFSGTFFPIEVLPGALQPVAWAAPLTPLVQLARDAVQGELGPNAHLQFAYLLVLVVFFYGLAMTLMRRRLLK